SIQPAEGGDEGSAGNDGFVAPRAGPGGRTRVPGVHQRHRGREGSSRYQASTDRQWAKTDSGASAARPTRIEGRRRPSAPASRRPASEAASRERDGNRV